MNEDKAMGVAPSAPGSSVQPLVSPAIPNATSAVAHAPAAPNPDRTGMTYYRKHGCMADSADSPDCICWSPAQPPVQTKEQQ